MRIRLAEWARREGISFITAKRWVLAGRVPNAIKNATGRWLVDVPDTPLEKHVVIYGRVSSHEQKDDLSRQMNRLRDFAAAQGLVVKTEVADIGSGLNGHRKKLNALLRDATIGIIIVEHRDRLARFGVEYIESALAAQGRSIIVINENEQKLDLVQDFIDVVTSMCARIYGHRSAGNRAKAAVAAAEAVTS
jgi:predicted site-specific integrase-resolvase